MARTKRSERQARGRDESATRLSGQPRPERRDAAEHRARILQAARQLFAAHGVPQTSMARIARRAGVGQGTLYRRYAHKGDLCLALLKENAEALITELDVHVRAASEPGTVVLDRLELYLMRMQKYYQANAPLLIEVWRTRDKKKTSPYQSPVYLHITQGIRTLLAGAIARGEMPPLNVDLYAEIIMEPVRIPLYWNQRHDLPFSPQEIQNAVWQLIRHGLGT
jgi:AcrR family transcriptional regulator